MKILADLSNTPQKYLSNEYKLPLIVKEVQHNNIALYKGLDQ